MFCSIKNREEYIKSCLELAAKIHDGHGYLYFQKTNSTDFRFAPIITRFIDNQLVVETASDTLGVSKLLKPGTVITAINGIPVDSLIKKYRIRYLLHKV